MKKLGIAILLALALSGCGHKQVEYSPAPPVTMTREQAVEIVEQVFYEDYSKTKVQYVAVAEKFIVLSQGVLSKGTTIATADIIGNSAIGLGTSTVSTKDVGQRLYFNSIGKIGVFQRRLKSGQFAVVVRARTVASCANLAAINQQTLAREF